MSKYTRYVGDDTSALYVDGKLEVVGDHYVVHSKIAEILGVEEVYSDAFWRGGNDYKHVAPSLSDIDDYSNGDFDLHDAANRRIRAAELRETARKLLEEADSIS